MYARHAQGSLLYYGHLRIRLHITLQPGKILICPHQRETCCKYHTTSNRHPFRSFFFTSYSLGKKHGFLPPLGSHYVNAVSLSTFILLAPTNISALFLSYERFSFSHRTPPKSTILAKEHRLNKIPLIQEHQRRGQSPRGPHPPPR